jgi:hypothetical protein
MKRIKIKFISHLFTDPGTLESIVNDYLSKMYVNDILHGNKFEIKDIKYCNGTMGEIVMLILEEKD